MVPGLGSVPARLRADPARAPSTPGGWLAVLALLLGAACTDQSQPPAAAGPNDGKSPTSGPTDRCASPETGCPCDDPGKLVDCGQTTLRSGDYVTCSEGQRICSNEGTWSECVGDHVTTRFVPEGDRRTLQLGTPQDCTDPCDPLCRSVVDTGGDIEDLTDNLCLVGGGLGVCTGCGYTGPHATSGYTGLPEAWQRLPELCDSDSDCSFDTRCVNDRCQRWGYPCYDAAGENCAQADLVLGPPCLAGSTYHIQLCNRGFTRVDAGTLQIGLFSDPAQVGQCVGAGFAAPDAGRITFSFGAAAGQFLEPGRCVDIDPGNSTATGLSLGSVRAVATNYDGAIPECNLCNNWNVLDPAAECSGCRGIECSQVCAETTLTGTVLDPRGVNPLPGVAVYIPLDELSSFPDDMACDTCASLYSGSPLVSAVTGADGTFTLTNVPSNVNFELVMQTGRWRRRVPVPAIAPCTTRTLPAGDGRLPRTQTRCAGSTCTGEGDIPLMALLLGDADPLQCLFRKIGVDESEFTTPNGNGRIHLFNHNGMQKPGSPQAYSGAGAMLSNAAQLDRYNAVFAPCDFKHNTFSEGRSGSGPAFNNHPDPTATPTQQQIMKSYVDRGGRLFATHWMSLDFVYTSFERPAPAPFVTPAMIIGAAPGWTTHPPPPAAPFNAEAPIRHLFGDNVNRAGNAQGAGPAFDYAIDASTPLGQLFSTWASLVGASPAGPGTVTFTHWAQFMDEVRAPAIRLAYGNTTAPPHSAPLQSCVNQSCTGRRWGTPHAAIAQFDTPFDAPASEQCGRVVVAQSHVAEHPTCQLLSTDGCNAASTPQDCACISLPGDGATPAERDAAWNLACGNETTPLTPQEKAFEFLVFSTTQCVGPVAPPPPSVNLLPGEFVREYEGVCGPNESPVWRHFSWEATIPTGTSVTFTARTADDRADLASADPVGIGVADETTTTWTSLDETVDDRLRAGNPAQSSRRWLRVTMRLDPSGTVSPTLENWRQIYDCIPSQ